MSTKFSVFTHQVGFEVTGEIMEDGMYKSYHEKLIADVAKGMGMTTEQYRRWALWQQEITKMDRKVAHIAANLTEEPKLVLANGEHPYE